MAKKKREADEEEVPQLTDRTLFKLWREREEIEARITSLAAKKKARDDKILTEFERRGIKTITSAETGERITYTQSSSVVYMKDALVARLKKSPRGREILKRCEKTEVDMKAIAAEVQAGHIAPKIVRECSEIKHAKPYLRGGKADE